LFDEYENLAPKIRDLQMSPKNKMAIFLKTPLNNFDKVSVDNQDNVPK
jgi:hypothetical protein